MAKIDTKLDANQVLRQAYDETNQRLRVDAKVSASISDLFIEDPEGHILNVNPDGSINAVVAITAADGDNIAIKSATGNELAISAAGAISLPTGAATAALQTQPGVDIGDVTINNAAGVAAVNIQDGGNSITVDGTVGVNNFPATQAVSAVSLPLPTGAATDSSVNVVNNSIIKLGVPTLASAVFTVTGQSLTINCTGLSAVLVDIQGTFVANVNMFGSVDNNIVADIPMVGTALASPDAIVPPITFPLTVRFNTAGFTHIKVLCSNLTSGSIAVKASAANGASQIDSILGTVFTRSTIRDADGIPFTGTTQGLKHGLDTNIINTTLPLPTGASTETTVASINTKTPVLGQALMAASTPVVIASNQSAVPVSVSNAFALDATLTNGTQKSITRGGVKGTTVAADVTSTSVDANTQGLDTVIKLSALPTGAATETTLVSLNTKVTAVNTGAVTISTALPAGTNSIGQVTTNAGTNTSTAALNLEATQAAISAKLPATLGTKVAAASLAVTMASDQTAIPVSGIDTTATGTIAASLQAVAITLNGKSGVALQITGTWVGTLQFQGTIDGANWVAISGVFAGTSTPGTAISANGIVRLTPSGLAQMRIIATAWTSGAATISIRASDATGGTFLNQSLTAGTNSIGAVTTNPGPGIATYSASHSIFTPAATPTDIVRIIGSATKTVKVWKVEMTNTQTTGGANNFFLIKRTTANTAGTAVNSTSTTFDTLDAAATAVINHYTTNPTTLGTGTTICTTRVFTPAPATVVSTNNPFSWDFRTPSALRPIVLRGVAESLVVNFAGAALPAGLSVAVTIYWTEE